MPQKITAHPLNQHTNCLTLFLVFLKLGLTSFGGPMAHLGYFHAEFVQRRRWLNDNTYGDLVALCQFLPGPASSQVGMAIGLSRGGILGAATAWLGFTLPSALALIGFGLMLSNRAIDSAGHWLHGLKVVAVAVVAQALLGMGKTMCADKTRASIAVGAATLVTGMPNVWGQLTVIILGGLLGCCFLKPTISLPHTPLLISYSKRWGVIILAIFFTLLILLPLAKIQSHHYTLQLFAGFYQTGALVFGGGHVVLPLLQSQVVATGWVSNSAFLAGYGAAQAVPGPLFTLAAYLGAVSNQSPAGWLGAGIALVAIFLPSFLLVLGILPLWENVRKHQSIQRAMLGVNAAVVGLLLAAFYQPVWTSAILTSADFMLACVCFLCLAFWRIPPWLVVIIAAIVAGLGKF